MADPACSRSSSLSSVSASSVSALAQQRRHGMNHIGFLSSYAGTPGDPDADMFQPHHWAAELAHGHTWQAESDHREHNCQPPELPQQGFQAYPFVTSATTRSHVGSLLQTSPWPGFLQHHRKCCEECTISSGILGLSRSPFAYMLRV